MVPLTLTSFDSLGVASDRATDGMAASWRMTSQPAAAASRAAGSRMLPSVKRDPIAEAFETGAETGREVIDDADLVTTIQQAADQVMTDEPRTARDQDPHARPP